ncbi:ATP synthase subunit O, mitochondrial [Manduca sexta]|uniref:Oligomycin sensitivity conferral protein n=1 Tax=Manduca sexta TaxID=7130 RepID=A0A921YN36_MANSE|nr:ATP synthase subunit O, mitochondrial [Manduca sexta]KAG6442333.1 hypothetical protein O3G_MSEX002309 [Manduca sexta]
MLRMVARNMCSLVRKMKTPMSVYGIEGNYVTALYSAALQKNQLEDVEKHLRKLLDELNRDKMLDFIETRFIPTITKARLLKESAEQAGMPETAVNFLKVVAENNRLRLLKRIILMFLDMMTAHRNESICEVTTAEPLDEVSRQKLVEAIQKHVKQGKKIVLTEKVDEEIIGGMIVGIEDMLIDISTRRKIIMYANLIRHPV